MVLTSNVVTIAGFALGILLAVGGALAGFALAILRAVGRATWNLRGFITSSMESPPHASRDNRRTRPRIPSATHIHDKPTHAPTPR